MTRPDIVRGHAHVAKAYVLGREVKRGGWMKDQYNSARGWKGPFRDQFAPAFLSARHGFLKSLKGFHLFSFAQDL